MEEVCHLSKSSQRQVIAVRPLLEIQHPLANTA